MSEKPDKKIEGFWVVLLKVFTDPVTRALETVSSMTILGVLFFFALFAILFPAWIALLAGLALLGLVGWIEHLNKRIAFLKRIETAWSKLKTTPSEKKTKERKEKDSSSIRFLVEMVTGLCIMKLILYAIDPGPLTRWDVFSISFSFFGLVAAPGLYLFWRTGDLLAWLYRSNLQTTEILVTFFDQLTLKCGGIEQNKGEQPHPVPIPGGDSQENG